MFLVSQQGVSHTYFPTAHNEVLLDRCPCKLRNHCVCGGMQRRASYQRHAVSFPVLHGLILADRCVVRYRYITAAFNENDLALSAAAIQGIPLQADAPAYGMPSLLHLVLQADEHVQSL